MPDNQRLYNSLVRRLKKNNSNLSLLGIDRDTHEEKVIYHQWVLVDDNDNDIVVYSTDFLHGMMIFLDGYFLGKRRIKT